MAFYQRAELHRLWGEYGRAEEAYRQAAARAEGDGAQGAPEPDPLPEPEPLPAFPASMRGAEIELVAPINFRLK